jgi:hypothetical protein
MPLDERMSKCAHLTLSVSSKLVLMIVYSAMIFTIIFLNYFMTPNDSEYDACDAPLCFSTLLEIVIY